MKKLALFLLCCPFLVLADEVDVSPPADAAESDLDDKVGNFKFKLAKGWFVDGEVSQDPEAVHRFTVARGVAAHNGTIAAFDVFRFSPKDANTFKLSPGEMVNRLCENGVIDSIFGDGAYGALKGRLDIDEGTLLGTYSKSGTYTVRSPTFELLKEIEEKQQLKDRGDKTVVVPEAKEWLSRGRVALLAPHVYFVRGRFPPAFADNEQLLSEFNTMMESWEFHSTERMPPALEAPDQKFGDTRAGVDPEAKPEKGTLVIEAQKGGEVVATLKVKYVLPPGFKKVDTLRNPDNPGAIFGVGESLRFMAIAQDDKNGWVWIKFYAASAKLLKPRTKFTDKKVEYASWVSAFTSKARGAGRIKPKPANVTLGNIRGKGIKLEGKINGFPATEENLVDDKWGWRMQVEIWTRGTGSETFADDLKTFVRKFRAQKG